MKRVLYITTDGDTRQGLRDYIRSLEIDPFDEGDFSETDSQGRIVFTKIVSDFAISFFVDHAVKEVKVYQLIRADK